ncbi:hypothetical protein [Nonomuraea sp. NPDC048901]|uniref:hypothetical protein n=1 Tax=unclassified Nonomuraea TaxID=2593643 RepID=UPI0034062982
MTTSIVVRCGRAYDGGGGPSQTGWPLGGGADSARACSARATARSECGLIIGCVGIASRSGR